MSQGLAFLIWLICVGISAILIGYFIRGPTATIKKEGFAVHSCPSGTVHFITGGETQCCNGDIVDGLCNGDVRCTLSPKSKSGLPTCRDLAKSDADIVGKNKCPVTLPNYFASNLLRGCSASPATLDGTAPSDSSQPQCILYPTSALDQVKLDSCYNVSKAAADAARLARLQNLPACKAADAAANAAAKSNSACPPPPPTPSCPTPPPIPNFVLTGDWIGGRIPIQNKYVMPNGNIAYAIQGGQFTKMVVTDMNNITITARYYTGSVAELNLQAADMSKVNTMGDATGHYILATAP